MMLHEVHGFTTIRQIITRRVLIDDIVPEEHGRGAPPQLQGWRLEMRQTKMMKFA